MLTSHVTDELQLIRESYQIKEKPMDTVKSKDGTVIAFDAQGDGPAVIFVDGAMSTRSGKHDLANLLAQHFTVYGYDRRVVGIVGIPSRTPSNGRSKTSTR